MASHRKLRAAAVVCAVVVVMGPAPAVAWAAPARAGAVPSGAAAPAPAPSPDPFEGLTADEIGDRAVTATQSATSLRMTGRVVSDGQPLDIDFAVNDSDECTGVMKIKGGTSELRRVDHVTYIKGDKAFWRASMASQGMPEAQITATLELIKDRWLKIAPGQAGSQDLGGVCDLKSLLADLDKDKEQRRGLTRGPDGKVDKTPVATLVKKKARGETATVSVSEQGKPYILKMVRTGGKEPGTLVLSDYDKPVDVKAPPPDETVDLSKLDQGTSA
ncbi:hypothetical protein [Streptomyces sp. TLI_105]|uniref:hypothetical protein n=1 Tax=Streptomyces sp. TLI_105 TaxID=1881019 RepID=UPI000897F1CF|nr:hypothetical protein [Streptomyces sp. TLI_105]SEC54831.1 hypothetical protein SAMN05428939_2646 [Streptomyces sp. TLI_105]